MSFSRPLISLLALAGCLAAVLVLPFPVYGRYWTPIFDLAHAPSFFLAFMLARWLTRGARITGETRPSNVQKSESPVRSTLRLSAIFSGIWLIGLACELAQARVGRQTSVGDVLANTCGLTSAFCLSTSRMPARVLFRRLLLAASAGLLMMPAAGPVLELVECRRQILEFPLLASFERDRELHIWQPHAANVTLSGSWASHGSQSLQLTAGAGDRYPGATMIWPMADWSTSHAFEFDVQNPGEETIELGLNIADREHPDSGHDPTDRYRAVTSIAPGPTTIRVTTTELREAPDQRPMNMSRIAMIDVFVPDAKPGQEIRIDHLRLVGASTPDQ